MHHDDITSLVELGIKLFTDVNKARHDHHTNQYVNSDNLRVAGDLAKVGQKLYKIGSDTQRNRSSMLFTQWDDQSLGDVATLGFDKTDGYVGLAYSRADGNGTNVYKGGGKVYSDLIAILVSGYNRRTGQFLIMQGTSNDGYIMNLASWSPGDEVAYVSRLIRLNEWHLG